MALLNREFLHSLVAIGVDGKRFNCFATGFLVGFSMNKSKDPSKKKYRVFLVTNRHVFDGRNFVDLRFNTKDGKTKIFRQALFFENNEPRWLAHKNIKIDLAVLNVSPGILDTNNVHYRFLPEEIFAFSKKFEEIGIEVGDEVFVLGFPMGISGVNQNYPIVKAGIISRYDQELLKEQKALLIDSSIFPGNSGGPVVLKPSATSITGTKSVSTPYLLGVIASYIPYEEQLYTHQTTPPSVVSLSRENSGLSFIVPMDHVRQIYNRWVEKNKRLQAPKKPSLGVGQVEASKK